MDAIALVGAQRGGELAVSAAEMHDEAALNARIIENLPGALLDG